MSPDARQHPIAPSPSLHLRPSSSSHVASSFASLLHPRHSDALNTVDLAGKSITLPVVDLGLHSPTLLPFSQSFLYRRCRFHITLRFI